MVSLPCSQFILLGINGGKSLKKCIIFIYCGYGVWCAHAICLSGGRGSLHGSVLSFQHVSLGDRTQLGKATNALTH